MDFYRIYEFGRQRRTTVLFGSIGVCVLIVVIIIAALGDQLAKSKASLKLCRNNRTEDAVIIVADAIAPNETIAEVCTSPTCVVAAARIIRSMDTDVDPCTDFYQFACGGWIKRNLIQPYEFRSNQTTLLNDKMAEAIKDMLTAPVLGDEPRPFRIARNMYATCVDTPRIESIGLTPLTNLLDLFGGWPATLDSWDTTRFDWTTATAAAKRFFGLNIFLTVNTEIDLMNTSRSAIYVDQGSLTLPRWILVNVDDEANIPIVSAYRSFAISSAKVVRNFLRSGVSNADIASEVDDMLQFEINLAKITTPDGELNQTQMFNPMTVSQLQDLTDGFANMNAKGHINWLKYLNDIYNTSAGIVINSSERVVVVEKLFPTNLLELLDSTPNRILANYFHWRLVMDLGRETTKNMTDVSFAFLRAVYGIAEPEYRSRKCANQINRLLGFAISHKYAQANFNNESKAEVGEIVTNLKLTLKAELVAASWMDLSTTLAAVLKVDAIRPFIGYPNWINNRTSVDSYYNELRPSKDSHFENVQAMRSFLVTQSLKKLRKDTNRQEWITSPTFTRPFYSPKYNSLNLPAAALQPPFYVKGRPAALNYGAIGTIIGHEMIHSFDEQGRQFDKEGNLKNWWTKQSLDQFQSLTKCFVDQYSSYRPPKLIGTRVNGALTLNENIADNAGLEEAFRAYKQNVGVDYRLPGLEQFSPEQLFFISFANNFCGLETLPNLRRDLMYSRNSPLRFRVLGSLSNSEDFAQQFSCSAESVIDKCTIWN